MQAITPEEQKYEPRTFMKYSSAETAVDAPGQVVLMSCNEAIARGAIEAGVRVAASYPGSPLAYVLDSLASAAAIYPSMHVEWSTNEKCSYEVALGASMAGVRAICVMKNNGTNWIMDPLASAVIQGHRGLVIATNDDPGAETSTNEQETRYLAMFAEIPVLEPSTIQEAKDLTCTAFQLSEDLHVPVMVRITERMGWGREPVVLGEIQHHIREREAKFMEDLRFGGFRWLPWPARDLAERHMRFHDEATVETEKAIGDKPKAKEIVKAADSFPYNDLKMSQKARVGVITAGMCHPQVMEALKVLGMPEEVAVLKLAITHPLPKTLVKKLLSDTQTVLVVEEIEPFIENQVRALSAEMDRHAKILGKVTGHIPVSGEVERNHVGSALAGILERAYKPRASLKRVETAKEILKKEVMPPQRLTFCPGCPEFAALAALKFVVNEMGVTKVAFGDDGCHWISGSPPLQVEDVSLTMGSSIGCALGLSQAGVKDKVIGVIGDSTFLHAGIPALINGVYNRANVLVYIMDNGTTGMTGHQPHPGALGITATGKPTKILDIAEIARACQADLVEIVDPYDFKETCRVLEQALDTEGVCVVIAKRTCALVALRQKGVKQK